MPVSTGLVALVTVPDEGAAELIASALELRGISVEIVPMVNNVYFGGATAVSLEVRVPAEHLDAARAALEHLEDESPGAGALATDAGIPELPDEPGDAERAAGVDQPAPPRRPRMWLGIPISMLVPFPVTLLYSRHPRTGWLALATSVVALAWTLVARDRTAAMVWVVLKVLDVVMAPLLVARANRAAGGREGVGLGVALTLLFAGVAATAGMAWWQYAVVGRQEAEATQLLNRALDEVNRGVEPQGPDGAEVRFPDTSLGRMYGDMLAYRKAYIARTMRIQQNYAAERDAWDRLESAQPDAAWLATRTTAIVGIRVMLEDEEREERRFMTTLGQQANHDKWARAWYYRLEPQISGPASVSRDLREALGALVATWHARVFLLGKPPTGDDRDRAERQRLADEQRQQTTRIETILRGLGQ